MRYIFAIFSPWMMYLVRKVTVSASFKSHFPKILEQAPLKKKSDVHYHKRGEDDFGSQHNSPKFGKIWTRSKFQIEHTV